MCEIPLVLPNMKSAHFPVGTQEKGKNSRNKKCILFLYIKLRGNMEEDHGLDEFLVIITLQ